MGIIYVGDRVRTLEMELEFTRKMDKQRITELEEKLAKCVKENNKIVNQLSKALAYCGYVYDESREPELAKIEAKHNLEQRALALRFAVETLPFNKTSKSISAKRLIKMADDLTKQAEKL